jgi:hypothetical protein
VTAERRVARYLLALAALARECADKPALWPVFLRVLRLVPSTVAELEREGRRLAA